MDDIDTIALWDAVAAADDPADCDVARLALADRLSEIGDGDMEYALRWAVKHGRHPILSRSLSAAGADYRWRWKRAEYTPEALDPEFLQEHIWQANRSWINVYYSYHDTIRDAYHPLAIALKALREAIAI